MAGNKRGLRHPNALRNAQGRFQRKLGHMSLSLQQFGQDRKCLWAVQKPSPHRVLCLEGQQAI